MDLQLRFKTFFGESEKSEKLWIDLNKNYSDDSNAYHNWNFVSECLQRLDKEFIEGVDLSKIEEALWISSSTDAALDENSNEALIVRDIQNTYILKNFDDCWESLRLLENELFRKDKTHVAFKACRQQLKKIIKGESFFKSEYFKNNYAEQALENVQKIYERVTQIRKYKPRPYDTSAIELPVELNSLLEKMAENIHENWSQLRLDQGWRYGISRDGKEYTHPCLTPYDILPDNEKDYDRQTSLETLKFILAKNYKILPPEKAVNSIRLEAGELSKFNVRELIQIQKRLKNEKEPDAGEFLVLGQAFQQQGEKVLSYETFQIGLKILGGEKNSQLYRDMSFNAARSLADCFAYKEAEKILQDLIKNGFNDGYITGQLAKIRKILAIKHNDQKNLSKALEYYREGYEAALEEMEVSQVRSDAWYSAVDQAVYNGINTATMYMLSSNREKCIETAERVIELCGAKEDSKISYWDKASMGEACLLEGEIEKASQYYREAADEAPAGDEQSMITQIHSICDFLELDKDWISKVFDIPSAVIFRGHCADRKDEYRFPTEDESRVTAEIQKFIAKEKPGFAYCCATPGSEIIFIEQMLLNKAEVHVYLPYEEELFLKLFEDRDPSWLDRYKNIKNKFTSLTVTGTYDEGLNDANSQFNNKYMSGLALLKAESSNCELKALTLWDGIEDSRSDSVPGAVAIWKKAGINIEVIDSLGKESIQKSAVLSFPNTKVEEELCMLFADVKGYSKLAGEQLIKFTQHFMGMSDKIISKHDQHVKIRRSMGDGLFLVFDSIEAAIAVSVGLKEMVIGTDWKDLDLPEDLTARFALACGPCYSFTDPISREYDLSGAHVIRTARLEPVTPPGHIFASEGFAAVCALKNLQDHFELAGQVKLPKSYGEMRVYYLDNK